MAAEGRLALQPGVWTPMCWVEMFRIVRLALLALALLAAPLGVVGGGPAMAHAANANSATDCPERSAPSQEEGSAKLDCMSICSAIAAAPEQPFQRPIVLVSSPAEAQLAYLDGILPERELPPPRLS